MNLTDGNHENGLNSLTRKSYCIGEISVDGLMDGGCYLMRTQCKQPFLSETSITGGPDIEIVLVLAACWALFAWQSARSCPSALWSQPSIWSHIMNPTNAPNTLSAFEAPPPRSCTGSLPSSMVLARTLTWVWAICGNGAFGRRYTMLFFSMIGKGEKWHCLPGWELPSVTIDNALSNYKLAVLAVFGDGLKKHTDLVLIHTWACLWGQGYA